MFLNGARKTLVNLSLHLQDFELNVHNIKIKEKVEYFKCLSINYKVPNYNYNNYLA